MIQWPYEDFQSVRDRPCAGAVTFDNLCRNSYCLPATLQEYRTYTDYRLILYGVNPMSGVNLNDLSKDDWSTESGLFEICQEGAEEAEL
jgi:hypothetical protein